MARFRVGVIGAGKPYGMEGRTGAATGHVHGRCYKQLADKCEIVAVADLVQDNADYFARTFGVPHTYTDYGEMLAKERLDIVSICTWPPLHEPMAVRCAEAGVRAIHCEKPMATTWGGCLRMAEACRKGGVQITFNHMRRWAQPVLKAKQMLDAGEIGSLVRVEFGWYNLCDYGSHQFDLCNFFNDQSPVQWVMAQVDYRSEVRIFGEHQENQALALWHYDNGVQGLAITAWRADMNPMPHNRLVGTEGVIEVQHRNGPVLRVCRKGGAAWEDVPFAPGVDVHGPGTNEAAMAHVIECLETGAKPQIGLDNTLQSTELIFASWESSRRRGRVDLPLDAMDNALAAMVESGDLKPAPKAP